MTDKILIDLELLEQAIEMLEEDFPYFDKSKAPAELPVVALIEKFRSALSAPQQEAVAERGPWRVGVTGEETQRVFIESDDFTHDVRLYVNGDFTNHVQHMAYAKEIANRLNTHPATNVPEWPILDKPAKVGGGRFHPGVSTRLVVEAAQRHYEYEVTPEKEAERIARATEAIDAIVAEASPKAPSVPEGWQNEIDRLKNRATCGCGDMFTEHDPGTCGNCVAAMRLSNSASPKAPSADDRKDAARYRWLRDVGDATWRPFALREGYSAGMADMAIDEAMLKTPNAEIQAASRGSSREVAPATEG